MKIRQVPPSVYGEDYFIERYRMTDERMVENAGNFEHIYIKSGSYLKLKNDYHVIDLGCGSGQMSIYLNFKYGCSVTGIDYSQPAVDLSNKNKESFFQKLKGINPSKIEFVCQDNKNLPEFSDIKAVFMLDFLEHLYPEEINLILEKIKKWNNDKIYLVIRTDNKYYLKYIRPIGDMISIYFGGASRETINRNKKIELERHVNIMSVGTVKKILRNRGYKILKVDYPEIDKKILTNQLDVLGRHKLLMYPILFLGKALNFLLPSMYIIAKYQENNYESPSH